jgi:hypothetical protein
LPLLTCLLMDDPNLPLICLPDEIDDLLGNGFPDKIDASEVQRHPPGIQAVVVNGKTVVEEGECLDVFPGKVRRQDLCVPAL